MLVRRIGLVVALVVVLTVAASAPATALVVVRGGGQRWRPSVVDIDRREVVRWRAVSGIHTVRAYGGNWKYSKRIGPGESVQRRFKQRGTYRFFCSIHGRVAGGTCTGMCGRVSV
jgi:plastocyanin